ncbi:OLC1v1000819C1 [Oldenlandia corymbosa var. corymbosa]|uniref:OLC1v1000819C1 n=1 Tax=Oldenlandia corymbosa var. corymbosa TaxID=529605 RepID=A0AAV1D3P0_OLDCO|nr:OLC1v1000819C1 [Oldenlandia corymbosa var. corymbosa]
MCAKVSSEIITGRTSHGCDQEVHVDLNVKLKVPVCNPGVSLDLEDVKKNRHVKRALKDHKFKVVNSCNGFLCLSEVSTNESEVVFNPVTDEFVNLPNGNEPYEASVDCGFGFCLTTNQYKLIRIFDTGVNLSNDCPTCEGKTNSRNMEQVHSLGTQSWKNVGYAPFYFEKQSFQNFPAPPSRDALLMMVMWVMEKYGVEESWTKLVKLEITENGFDFVCQPVDYLKCGSLPMFYFPNNIFIHCNVETEEWDCLKVCGTKSICEAIPFAPSFFTLKEALPGDGKRVTNISLRRWNLF